MINLYEILGVSREACRDEIKAAFKSLAQQLHPDRNYDPGTAERFQAVQKAWEVLKNPKRRAEYDATGNTERNTDHQAALNRLCGYFMAVMQSWDGYSDPIRGIAAAGRREKLVVREHVSGIQHQLRKLEKLERRFRFKGEGANVLQNLIDQQRAGANRQVNTMECEVAEIDRALALLGDYESVHDLVNALPSYGGIGLGSGLFTGNSGLI